MDLSSSHPEFLGIYGIGEYGNTSSKYIQTSSFVK